MSTLKDFEVIKTLGSGSYSCVYKVRRISDSQEYAMKKVKLYQLKPKEKENALNEVRILASINDPNIIGYKEAFFDDSSQSLCIIMEYAGGGDLLNKINEHKKNGTYFSEENVWKYIIQMIKGLRQLHNMKILHRDLKCANVFLTTDENAVKLGDLNVSKVAKKGLVYTQTGTPYYASPEVWRDEPYDMKSDIWSLGCVIYEMVALKPPFRANDMDGLYKKVQKGTFEKIPNRYSNDLSNLICMCLSVYSSSRPTCDQLLNNPIIIKRLGGESVKIVNTAQTPDLLGTIKVPKNMNMKALADKLPKPKYNERKNSMINRSLDIQSHSQQSDIVRLSLDADNRYGAKRASSSNTSKRVGSVCSNYQENDRDILSRSPVIRNKKEPIRGVSLDVDNNRIGIRNSYDYVKAIRESQDYILTKKPNYASSKRTADIQSSKEHITPYQKVANSILKANCLVNPSYHNANAYVNNRDRENSRESRDKIKPLSSHHNRSRPSSKENRCYNYNIEDKGKPYSNNCYRPPSANQILRSLDNVINQDRYNLNYAYGIKNNNYHPAAYNPNAYITKEVNHNQALNNENRRPPLRTNLPSSGSQKPIRSYI